MVLVEIADGTTVADDEVLETPIVAEDSLQQASGTATGIIVETLVGAHHFAHLGILYQSFESGHVGLPEIAHGHVGEIGGVAGVLRTAVHGIVLGTSPEFAVSGILRPLQSLDHLHAHDTRQIGILAIGLLTTSPAGITEDVHVGRPYRETAHLHILAAKVVHTVVVLGAELGACNVEYLI